MITNPSLFPAYLRLTFPRALLPDAGLAPSTIYIQGLREWDSDAVLDSDVGMFADPDSRGVNSLRWRRRRRGTGLRRSGSARGGLGLQQCSSVSISGGDSEYSISSFDADDD